VVKADLQKKQLDFMLEEEEGAKTPTSAKASAGRQGRKGAKEDAKTPTSVEASVGKKPSAGKQGYKGAKGGKRPTNSSSKSRGSSRKKK
jgi:hypothetical protein